MARNVIAAVLASSAWVASAQAQEHIWTGLYGGVHLGGVTRPGADFNDVGVPSGAGGTPSFTAAQVKVFTGQAKDVTDFMGGAQIGYNWLFNRSFVVGLETDFSFVSPNATTFSNRAFDAGNGVFLNTEISNSDPIKFLGTVRGRLGYLVSDRHLLFVTGGFAYAQTDTGSSLTTSYPGTVVVPDAAKFGGGRSMQAGYTVGGGMEYAISRNVSLKFEGLYYDLGEIDATTTFNSFNTGGVYISTNTLTKTQSLDGAIARVGINYSF